MSQSVNIDQALDEVRIDRIRHCSERILARSMLLGSLWMTSTQGTRMSIAMMCLRLIERDADELLEEVEKLWTKIG